MELASSAPMPSVHAGAELVGAVPVVVGGKFGEAGRLQLVEGELRVCEDLRGGEAGVGVEQAGADAADEGGFATACVHEAHDEGLIAGADRGAGGEGTKRLQPTVSVMGPERALVLPEASVLVVVSVWAPCGRARSSVHLP